MTTPGVGPVVDLSLAVINVPAFLAVVCGSAAGKFGHALSKRRRKRLANRPIDCAWNAAGPLPNRGC